jgi:hypothetical protein
LVLKFKIKKLLFFFAFLFSSLWWAFWVDYIREIKKETMKGGPVLWTTNRFPTRIDNLGGGWLTDAQLACQKMYNLLMEQTKNLSIFLFPPFSSFSNLFVVVVPQQHYFLLWRGVKNWWNLQNMCIVILFTLFFDPICRKNKKMSGEGHRKKKNRKKKKNIFPNTHQQMYFIVINTNGVCQIWPGIHLYGPCFVYCSCVCIYSLYNHNDRWCAIGIGADLFSLSFFLAPPPL